MNGTNSKQIESRIPVPSPSPLRRSGSMRLGACTPIKEHKSDVIQRPTLNRHRSLQMLNTASSFSHDAEDDTESVKSFSSLSGASVCSNVSQCDHANFARNGTTYSGRCKRYVYHCSPHSTQTDDYLTPTQRTNRTIRKLRSLLREAQEELAQKDREIQRLTKEVVELRLLKADSGGGLDGVMEQGRGGGDAQPSPTPPPPITPGYCSSPPLAQSLSDSGHFEELNSSHNIQAYINQIKTLESTLESLQRQHEDDIRELKEKHNDKVDSLLQRITDVNDRYYALRPLYEDCKDKIHELEKLNEDLKNGSGQTQISNLSELQLLNETLLHDKQALAAEIESLNRMKEELELSKLNCGKLKQENDQLKSKQEELIKLVKNIKEEKCEDIGNLIDDIRDGISQTEVDQLCNGNTHITRIAQESCEQSNQSSLRDENSKLKQQILAHTEKIKMFEEQQQKEKDIYMELYKKGIQAAKLDSEEVQGENNKDTSNSLIPDLLQKLRIKQEELDNVKAMYRRLLESRKEQPKHDPEMTLQFLKSAFYYFLTDRENAPGHLAAIESILGFTDNEKINIERAFLWR